MSVRQFGKYCLFLLMGSGTLLVTSLVLAFAVCLLRAVF